MNKLIKFLRNKNSIKMAWRSHGTDNKSLVENLYKNEIIKSNIVKEAMLQTDRAYYANSSLFICIITLFEICNL